jgi:hypothetical protein
MMPQPWLIVSFQYSNATACPDRQRLKGAAVAAVSFLYKAKKVALSAKSDESIATMLHKDRTDEHKATKALRQ